MSRKKKTQRRDGFTLIEILIVVVLLGVLAAIVIPMFTDSSQDANLAACMENLRLTQGAMSIYRLKNEKYPSQASDLSPYLQSIPACPMGGSYTLTLAADKYHIVCAAQHTPSISHVCIHEDQKPTAK